VGHAVAALAMSGRHATIGVVTVIGLGAWCDYVSEREHRDRLSRPPFSYPSHEVEQALEQFRGCASFRVQEFAVLVDGRRLTLTDDVSGQRGFSSRTGSYGRRSAPIDPWALLTLEGLEASVRTTVLPDDDDTGEDHPWEWLAQRLRARDVEVSPEQLKLLPYDVVFSQRLRDRVSARPPEGPLPPQA
jgi:hypothetical protein